MAADVVPAGFWRRWGAYIIDTLLLSIGFFVVVFALFMGLALAGYMGDLPDEDAPWLDLTTVLLMALYYVAAAFYYALQESSVHQATLGKRAMGIKVTGMGGQRITRRKAFMRWFAAALSYLTLYIGFLVAAFTRRKQALHDLVVDTLVVDRWAYTDTPERQQRHIGILPILLAVVVMFIPLLGILAAIAIPAYQDYTVRAKVAMAVDGTADLRQPILDFRAEHGACPENGEAGFGAPEALGGPYASAIDIGTLQDTGNCGLQVTLRDIHEKVDGQRLWLEYDAATRQWACSSEVEDRYLPTRCQG